MENSCPAESVDLEIMWVIYGTQCISTTATLPSGARHGGENLLVHALLYLDRVQPIASSPEQKKKAKRKILMQAISHLTQGTI